MMPDSYIEKENVVAANNAGLPDDEPMDELGTAPGKPASGFFLDLKIGRWICLAGPATTHAYQRDSLHARESKLVQNSLCIPRMTVSVEMHRSAKR